MIVHVHAVGVMNREVEVEWPEGWPIPREGDSIAVPEMPEVSKVRNVTWYPRGEEPGDPAFVYIVIGPH